YDAQILELNKEWGNRMIALLKGKTAPEVVNTTGELLVESGIVYHRDLFDTIDPYSLSLKLKWCEDDTINKIIRTLVINYRTERRKYETEYKRRKYAIQVG